jgi:hypothetical protein
MDALEGPSLVRFGLRLEFLDGLYWAEMTGATFSAP